MQQTRPRLREVDSLAPTEISTIVEPAELNAFHNPKAVPIQACDGTSNGIDAMKGIWRMNQVSRKVAQRSERTLTALLDSATDPRITLWHGGSRGSALRMRPLPFQREYPRNERVHACVRQQREHQNPKSYVAIRSAYVAE